jgi:hypothetical protein
MRLAVQYAKVQPNRRDNSDAEYYPKICWRSHEIPWCPS